jgi:hypothetical protein
MCSCHLYGLGVLVEYEKTFVKKGLTLFFDRGILLLAPNKNAWQTSAKHADP